MPFVQGTSGFNPASGTSATTDAFVSNTAVGNSLVVSIRFNNQAANISSVVDNKTGNTYEQVIAPFDHTSGTRSLAVYRCKSLVQGGAGHTVTVNIDAASFDIQLIVHEVSTLDATELSNATGTDAAEAGTVVDVSCTPTVNGCYLFGTCSAVGNTDSIAPNTGTNAWVERMDINPAADTAHQTQDFTQTTAATIACEWTTSSTGNMLAAVAAFKPSQPTRFILGTH